MVYMYHSFLIHSSADGHLGCFHVLAIINSAADICTSMFIAALLHNSQTDHQQRSRAKKNLKLILNTISQKGCAN